MGDSAQQSPEEVRKLVAGFLGQHVLPGLKDLNDAIISPNPTLRPANLEQTVRTTLNSIPKEKPPEAPKQFMPNMVVSKEGVLEPGPPMTARPQTNSAGVQTNEGGFRQYVGTPVSPDINQKLDTIISLLQQINEKLTVKRGRPKKTKEVLITESPITLIRDGELRAPVEIPVDSKKNSS